MNSDEKPIIDTKTIKNFEKFAKTKRSEYFKHLDPHIKEVVDYYKPAMYHANLIDLKALNEGKGWNHDMTVLILDIKTYNTFKQDKPLADPNADKEETFTSGPQILNYVFGTFTSTYETIYQMSYETVYEALDRLGYVDAYVKAKEQNRA